MLLRVLDRRIFFVLLQPSAQQAIGACTSQCLPVPSRFPAIRRNRPWGFAISAYDLRIMDLATSKRNGAGGLITLIKSAVYTLAARPRRAARSRRMVSLRRRAWLPSCREVIYLEIAGAECKEDRIRISRSGDRSDISVESQLENGENGSS